MQMYFLIVGALGVWRVTHLLSQESGPGDVLSKFRRFAGNGFWGELLRCFYCMSLWISAPFALLLGDSWKQRALLWLALSGAAILMERFSAERDRTARDFYMEDTTEDEHVLR